MTQSETGETRRDEHEQLGGDPPCWAHFFEDESTPAAESSAETRAGSGYPVDLGGNAHAHTAGAVAWSLESADLDVNLVVFAAGEGVAEHVNSEVDVLLVGIAGEGAVSVDGHAHTLGAGHAILVPKGTRRSTQATSDRFAYLTCHRRRAALLPAARPKPIQ